MAHREDIVTFSVKRERSIGEEGDFKRRSEWLMAAFCTVSASALGERLIIPCTVVRQGDLVHVAGLGVEREAKDKIWSFVG